MRVLCGRCEERFEEHAIILKWLTALLGQPALSLKTAADAELVEIAATGLAKLAGKPSSKPELPTEAHCLIRLALSSML